MNCTDNATHSALDQNQRMNICKDVHGPGVEPNETDGVEPNKSDSTGVEALAMAISLPLVAIVVVLVVIMILLIVLVRRRKNR